MTTTYDYLVALYMLAGDSYEDAKAKAEADCAEMAEADEAEE